VTRLQTWILHGTVVMLAASGAVFAWMRYAMKTDDPFAVANHPLQPHMLHIHVLAAPIAVFAMGVVFAIHIAPKIENRSLARKKTGIGSLWMIAPMVLSGYLMQVVTSETAILAMKVMHWVSSSIFVLAYGVHQLLRAKNGASSEETDESAAAVDASTRFRGRSTEVAITRRSG